VRHLVIIASQDNQVYVPHALLFYSWIKRKKGHANAQIPIIPSEMEFVNVLSLVGF